MPDIKSRVVLHFPGFEPLDAELHRARFARVAKQTSGIYNVTIDCGELRQEEGCGAFEVNASGPNWKTQTQYNVFDLADHIAHLQSRPFLTQLASGYAAFLRVLAYGGTWNYFRHAWRFGLFAVFPFLFMALGLAIASLIVLVPWIVGISLLNYVWSLPLALAFFKFAFLPIANRFHTMLLFNDWVCAVDFATLKDARLNWRISEMVEGARAGLMKQADEHLIVSHSIGGNAAVHVIGQLILQEPELFSGKRVVFASVGSGILQGALMLPAKVLRERVKLIAANTNIFWLDVQCMTDVSNFYKTNVARLCGYDGDRQPSIMPIRIKTMLTKERYDRIKRDLLRVHRQYVLGNDVRASYDFGLMCAGPLPAATFATLNLGQMPPINQDGSIRDTKA